MSLAGPLAPSVNASLEGSRWFLLPSRSGFFAPSRAGWTACFAQVYAASSRSPLPMPPSLPFTLLKPWKDMCLGVEDDFVERQVICRREEQIQVFKCLGLHNDQG